MSNPYGVIETNPLLDGSAYHSARHERGEVDLTLRELADRGGRITRVRLLTEVWGGYGRIADISYIHGMLPDGTPVRLVYTGEVETHGVILRKMKQNFINWGKSEGVYAKGIGLLDEGNWSILH